LRVRSMLPNVITNFRFGEIIISSPPVLWLDWILLGSLHSIRLKIYTVWRITFVDLS
jgi:hypothetical protein